MTPAARLQAASEILDEVIASASDDGPPADAIVTRYFKTAAMPDRRIAGRCASWCSVRSGAPRETALERASRNPRTWPGMSRPSLSCSGSRAARTPQTDGEETAAAGARSGLAGLRVVAADRRRRMAAHCSNALRSIFASTPFAPLATTSCPSFPTPPPTPLSPWGIRLPSDSRVDDHPAFLDGRVEIQDEGSQLIALACEPGDGERLLDLCAGAGGKALALAAAAPGATILATDSNRARLSKLAPRAERASAASRPACSIRPGAKAAR